MSLVPLERLVARGYDLRAVVIPSARPVGPELQRLTYRLTIPIGTHRSAPSRVSIDAVAAERRIPLFAARQPLGDAVHELLASLNPDVLVVSCFPWRLPNKLLNITPFGAVNLHPSLLPRFRGPDPLFWAFQSGAREWGVTIHALTSKLDAGPIFAQRSMQVSPEKGGDELEQRVSVVGADVLIDVLDRLRASGVSPVPQHEEGATYCGFPEADDLLLQPPWTIERVRNFVTGVQPLGHTPLVATERGTFEVLRVEHGPSDRAPACRERWISEHVVRLKFSDGVIDISVAERIEPV